MTELGLTSVAAVTVIAYLIGEGCKASEKIPDRWIPIICGISGAVFGIVGYFVIPDFPAVDLLTAAAVGIVSGFAATGINQIGKQLSKDTKEDDK